MTKNCLCVVALAGALAVPAAADVWDNQTQNDDNVFTTNDLMHGTSQTHDLGVRPGPLPDQDWYVLSVKPQASYEVVIDGFSGDVYASTFGLRRYAADGVTLLQTGVEPLPGSFNRVLRWMNTTSSTVKAFIQVTGAGCGTTCGSDDVYNIRMRETTVNIPRFNNTGTQTTIMLTQNPSNVPVNATFFFWSATGTLLNQTSAVVSAKGMDIRNALAAQSGHITMAQDGGYGGLVVKAVALEPATGFNFDTPGVYVPY